MISCQTLSIFAKVSDKEWLLLPTCNFRSIIVIWALFGFNLRDLYIDRVRNLRDLYIDRVREEAMIITKDSRGYCIIKAADIVHFSYIVVIIIKT